MLTNPQSCTINNSYLSVGNPAYASLSPALNVFVSTSANCPAFTTWMIVVQPMGPYSS